MNAGDLMKKKNRIIKIFAGLLIIVGLSLALFPFYSQALNTFLDQQILTKSQNSAKAREEKLLKQMRDQNDELKKKGISTNQDILDKKRVESDTDLKKSVIGEVIIPKLNLSTILFKDMNDKNLTYGAAVVPGTSMPIGGTDTHSVVAGHSGLMQHRIFTELNKLKKGDLFIFKVFDKYYAYKVYSIKKVNPNNVSALQIVSGKDVATLLTCTPIMINSHRLLVTGERVPYTPEIQKQEKRAKNNERNLQLAIIIGGSALMIAVIYLIYRFALKKRTKK